MLLPACYIPTLFILQTFLPSRRRDCFTPPTLPNPHYPMPRTKLARPRKRVRFCCSVKPSQLWWGLFLICTINEIFRTISPAFRRASVCVCLYGFASVQNSGHTRLRHPCLACSSRCTEPLYPHNHCKRTTYPRHAPHSCLACLSHCTALSPPHHTRLTTAFFFLQKQLYPFSRLFNCSNLFRTSLTSPSLRAILLLALAKTNSI